VDPQPRSRQKGRSSEVISTAFCARRRTYERVPRDCYGFSSHLPARLAPLLHASIRNSGTRMPSRFAMTSRPSACQRVFHFRAVEPGRHACKRARDRARALLSGNNMANPRSSLAAQTSHYLNTSDATEFSADERDECKTGTEQERRARFRNHFALLRSNQTLNTDSSVCG
jgi:hypothetical protein